MGILEDMQDRILALEQWRAIANDRSKLSVDRIDDLKERVERLESHAPPQPPPPPEPGWNVIWTDSMRVGADPVAPTEKHGAYLHQGLEYGKNRLTVTSDGLDALYHSETYEKTGKAGGPGPRCETGLWSADHPNNRIFQREPLDGKLRRYRLEVLFPAGWNPKNDLRRCTVWQSHGNNKSTATETWNPNVEFCAFYGKFRVWWRTQNTAHTRCSKQLDPLPLDRWIKLEVEAVWSMTDGLLRVLVDGDEWLLLEGETTMSDQQEPARPRGPYWRAGCYAPGDRTAPTSGATRRVMFRNFSVEERG